MTHGPLYFLFFALLSYVINMKIFSYAHLDRLLQSFVINMYTLKMEIYNAYGKFTLHKLTVPVCDNKYIMMCRYY